MKFEMTPIGFFKSNHKKNYEVTRQAVPVEIENPVSHEPNDIGLIELEAGHNFEQALLGLETFTHLWVLFVFHKNSHWKPMIAPPRPPLEGPQKMGVFATRSPHRPNFIGQSALQILKIEGRKIFVVGADLIDGTPILDIKPYVTYADSFPEASKGWLAKIPAPFEISYSELAQKQKRFLEEQGVIQLQSFIKEQLEYDPTQGHSKRIKEVIANKIYELAYKTWRIEFEINFTDINILIKNISSGYCEGELQNNEDPFNDKKIHHMFLNQNFSAF